MGGHGQGQLGPGNLQVRDSHQKREKDRIAFGKKLEILRAWGAWLGDGPDTFPPTGKHKFTKKKTLGLQLAKPRSWKKLIYF